MTDWAADGGSKVTREDWLIRAVDAMKPWLEEIDDVEVPEVRVSVGWPSTGGTGSKKRTVGQCWKRCAAEDGVNQIFISPVRGKDQTVEVLGTLIHEMIHAADDCESGHKGNFIRIAKAIGMLPKWTQTTMSEELTERMKGLIERIGPIPSAALTPGLGGGDVPPKQTTRQLKAECANGSGYKVRITQKWIDECGPPLCACCRVEMEIEEKD